jgi:hypothetical protein
MIEISDDMYCIDIETPCGIVRHCGTIEMLKRSKQRALEMWEDHKNYYRLSFGKGSRDNQVSEDPLKVLERYATPTKRRTRRRFK